MNSFLLQHVTKVSFRDRDILARNGSDAMPRGWTITYNYQKKIEFFSDSFLLVRHIRAIHVIYNCIAVNTKLISDRLYFPLLLWFEPDLYIIGYIKEYNLQCQYD